MYGALTYASDGDILLRALTGRPIPGSLPPDPERLMRVLLGHGLPGLLVERINGSVLAAIASRIREAASAQEGWVRLHIEAAREASSALEAAGVSHVFVKGVAMAVDAYERSAQRGFGDVDMLVERPNLSRTAQVLRALGFERVPTLPNPTQVHFVRSPGLTIDLHWTFTFADSLLAPIRVPTREILGRSHRVSGIRIPCLEDCLVLAAVSLVRSCVPSLILVVDFAQMARRLKDWNAVQQKAAAWGAGTCVWLGLRLAADWLDAPIPQETLRTLQPHGWRARLLQGLLTPARFWNLGRTRDWRYLFLLKILCLDSPAHVLQAGLAAPLGALRRLGLLGASPT